MTITQFLYYAKKAFALWPGVIRPVAAPVFAAHYERRGRRRSIFRAGLDAVVGTLFLLWLPLRARAIARKHGYDAQWRERSLAIARQRFIDPSDLALFSIDTAGQTRDYIRRFEDAAFNKIVNPSGWSRACVLVDKRAFYRICRESALPHPRVVAHVEDGSWVPLDEDIGGQLVVKPVFGEGGDGVAFVPEDLRADRDPDGLRAAVDNLVDGKQPWIVQQRLHNHPDFEVFGVAAVMTARLTTIRNEQGDSELVSCVLRVPASRDAAIDNMKAGGFIMPIEAATGATGVARRGYRGGIVERHPVSGYAFAGFRLPDWVAAKALAKQAHETAFATYRLIGWDVAFTLEGPVLVEGNAKPGVMMPQRAAGRGLAGQRYGELLAWNLAQAEQDLR